jgi:hypothetical protein
VSKERGAFVRAFQAKADKDAVLLAIQNEVKAVASQYPLFQM